MGRKKRSRFSPAQIFFSSILFTILIGTFLLSLPASRTVDMSLLDLLFTSTSVTCVTGLLTVPLSNFTLFGQWIILFLMQIGGLGLITMSIFLMSLFVELGFSTQLMAGEILELDSWKNIKRTLIFIISLTLGVEILGAFITFISLMDTFPTDTNILYSLFHSISSFCSAGFYLFPDGLLPLKTNNTLLLLTASLMTFGGLGFITWHELFSYFNHKRHKARFLLSLHTKIILITTIAIITTTVLTFWFLERPNTLIDLSFFDAFTNSLFNGISMRGTGFTTINPHEASLATILMIMIASFIGASPGSTGSGIKTTTLALFLATIRAAVNERGSVEIHGRRIAKDQIHKSLAVVALSVSWILLATFILLITEPTWEFVAVLFEVISAFATLGISLGITPSLSIIGKILILITMIIGRIGLLTIVLALKRQHDTVDFSYPEERVMLG